MILKLDCNNKKCTYYKKKVKHNCKNVKREYLAKNIHSCLWSSIMKETLNEKNIIS